MAGQYIADPENLLSPQTRNAVNRQLAAVREQTTAEVGVAIVPDLGDMEVEDFSNRLYDRWKIGKKDKSNGVLLIISPGSRQARIQTGYGTEGVITDADADLIMRHQIIPAMRQGDLDGAVEGAVSDISRMLTDPKYADELRSAQNGYGSGELLSETDKQAIKSTLSWLATILFFVGAVVLVYMWKGNRKKPRQQKVIAYRNMLWILLALGVVSFGAGLVWALIAWLLLRKARRTGDPCPNCGNKKRKLLSGIEATQYLTPSQMTETRLHSRNHDVWKCDQCGLTTVDTFDNPSSKYSVCDRCGTKAMHLVGTATLQRPSAIRNGLGERIYRCEHCGHERRDRYTIPSTGPAIAAGAAALGAASRRRGGGGYGGGGGFGGFGGGFSGGGGASGRW